MAYAYALLWMGMFFRDYYGHDFTVAEFDLVCGDDKADLAELLGPLYEDVLRRHGPANRRRLDLALDRHLPRAPMEPKHVALGERVRIAEDIEGMDADIPGGDAARRQWQGDRRLIGSVTLAEVARIAEETNLAVPLLVSDQIIERYLAVEAYYASVLPGRLPEGAEMSRKASYVYRLREIAVSMDLCRVHGYR